MKTITGNRESSSNLQHSSLYRPKMETEPNSKRVTLRFLRGGKDARPHQYEDQFVQESVHRLACKIGQRDTWQEWQEWNLSLQPSWHPCRELHDTSKPVDLLTITITNHQHFQTICLFKHSVNVGVVSKLFWVEKSQKKSWVSSSDLQNNNRYENKTQ